MRHTPAERVDGVLQQGRPDRAGEIVSAGDNGDGDAAAPDEPQRDVGNQRSEGRGTAEHADQQGLRQATRNDPRVTTIGAFLRRWSLDELPQLINVLRDEMSLVGPRPHAVDHNEQYRRLIPGYMQRHAFKPGITGLAQVNQGYDTSISDVRSKLGYDLSYSLALNRPLSWLRMDLKIAIQTVSTMLNGRGQ